MRACFWLHSGDVDETQERAWHVCEQWLLRKRPELERVLQDWQLRSLSRYIDKAVSFELHHVGQYRAFDLAQNDIVQPEQWWRTRVALVSKDHRLRFFCENSVAGANEDAVRATTPTLVRELVQLCDARDADLPLSPQPLWVHDDSTFWLLKRLLFSQERELPVLALSPLNKTDDLPVDAQELATRLLGVAHVAAMDDVACHELETLVGAPLKVFNGAARLFMPHLERGSSGNSHPLFVAPRPCREGLVPRNRAYQSFIQACAYSEGVRALAHAAAEMGTPSAPN